MRALPLLLVGALVGCADREPTDEPITPDTPVDFFARLADPHAPALRPPGEARLASSREPEPRSGYGNRDWANFVGTEGELGIILDERGPGVLTRVWLTQRSTMSAPAVEEDLVLRMWIDGSPVELAPGRESVGLVELTSGELEAFPRPWVAGPDVASGSFIVGVPIHFQRSIRLAVERRDGFDAYWWIDWRALPARSLVRSFDGTLTDAESASLAAAEAEWLSGSPGAEVATGSAELAGGGEERRRHELRGTLRELSVTVDGGEWSALDLDLSVDGERVAGGAAERWLMTASPTEPYASALSGLEGGTATLRFPTPVQAEIELLLRNRGDAPMAVSYALRADEGEPPDIGRLVVTCTREVGEERRNVTLAALDGPGHVAGHHLRMEAAGYGFAMLEGDPEILADGRELLGTGVEDLFGGAHYFIYGPFAQPEQGLVGLADVGTGFPRLSMYRHMLASGVDFEASLRLEYEVYDPGTVFDGCTYWYRAR